MTTITQRVKRFVKGHPFTEQEAKMQVSIYEDVFAKYLAYAKPMHPNEFGALLKITEKGEHNYLVEDVDFVGQTASPVTFVLDEIELAKWRMKKDKEDEDLSAWSGLIHTHPTQSAYPSLPDLDQLMRYSRNQPALSLICGINAHDKKRATFMAHYGRKAENGEIAMMINVPVTVIKREGGPAPMPKQVAIKDNPYLLSTVQSAPPQVATDNGYRPSENDTFALRSRNGGLAGRVWEWRVVR